MRVNRDALPRIGGWMLSLLLHALGIGTAVVLAAEFTALPREKSFQWEVSLISAPHPEPISSELPTAVPAASTPGRVTTQGVASASGLSEAAPPETIPARSLQGTASSILPSGELPRAQPAKRTPLRTHKTTHTTAPSRDRAMPEPLSQQTESSLSAPESTALFPTAAPSSGDIPPPAVDVAEQSRSTSEPSIEERVRVAYRPLPQYRDPSVTQTIHADYTWLAQVLFMRVEQLKRYPHLAKTSGLEGNVLLQAVVREDGHVGDVTVVESSGHPSLDQDAVALLERSSPISMKHPLGQPHIVIQLPIGYRLK